MVPTCKPGPAQRFFLAKGRTSGGHRNVGKTDGTGQLQVSAVSNQTQISAILPPHGVKLIPSENLDVIVHLQDG